MLKKHVFLHTVKCYSTVFPLSHHVSNSQSPLIGQLPHAWLSTINNSRAAVVKQFTRAKPAARHKLCACMTWCHSLMSPSHSIKGGTTDEAFKKQCFLWERGVSVGPVFHLFKFLDLLHAQEHCIKYWRKGKIQKKHNACPINVQSWHSTMVKLCWPSAWDPFRTPWCWNMTLPPSGLFSRSARFYARSVYSAAL